MARSCNHRAECHNAKMARLPQFSLFRLLALITLCGVLSLIPASTPEGRAGAVAAVLAVGSALIFLGIYGLLYLLTQGLARVLARRRRPVVAPVSAGGAGHGA